MLSFQAQSRRLFRKTLVLAVLTFCSSICHGHTVLTSYRHTSWSAEDGLGSVFDIKQAPDGYLWLTTSLGVFRFDGVHFESVEQATDGKIGNTTVDSVFVSNSGDIWFTTRTAGMLLWKGGAVEAFPDRSCTPSLRTDGIVEARDGSLWMQARSGLAHLHGTTCDQVGRERGYPGGFVSAILIDHRGSIWVEATSGDLLVLDEHASQFRKVGEGPKSRDFVFLHEAPDGAIWVANDFGLSRMTDAQGAVPRTWRVTGLHEDHTAFGNFAFAQDGSIWAGTRYGISRFQLGLGALEQRRPLDPNVAESYTIREGLTSNGIWKVLIDRERNIWVGSNGGLDRLRRTPFSSVDMPRGQDTEFGVVAGNSSDIWVGSRTVPLMHIDSTGRIQQFRSVRLTTCLRRDRRGVVWAAGAAPARLTRITRGHTEVIHYPEEEARGISGLELDKNNELWLLLFGGRTYRRSGDRWSQEDNLIGRKPGVLGTMTSDPEGNVWLAFSNKLVRWNGNSFDRFSFPDGPLNISVTTMFTREDRVWMGGTGGVSLFRHGTFHLLRCDRAELPGRVSGLVETTQGDLWINGYAGVTHVAKTELQRWLADPTYLVHADHLDALDGLPGLSGDRTPEPSIVAAPDGRLWFATTRSVAWLDPNTVDSLRNLVPPTVKALAVTAGGRSYRDVSSIRLPAQSNSVQIDYTALSLAEPGRISFRYRLDGVDENWQNPGTRRQAFYTKLSPATYHFRVIASNNDGVWNNTGATLEFSVAPAMYQTAWFRLLCLLACCIAVWLMIRLRISWAIAQVRSRLMERLSERERIAAELHDTLLQSVVALTLQLQTATDQLPSRDPIRTSLELALQNSEGVIDEARHRIRDLRREFSETIGLPEAIDRIGSDCKLFGSANFVVESKGRSFEIQNLVFEELLLIIREAVTNAYRHALAENVTVRVEYLPKGLWIKIADDGCGMDPVTLSRGRRNHWGLQGMRERTARIGGDIHISSRLAEGTEVSIHVPANLAYPARRRRLTFWRNLVAQEIDQRTAPWRRTTSSSVLAAKSPRDPK